MPLVGTRPVTALEGGPLVTDLQSERLELPGCGILQIMYEIDAEGVQALIPPALHPTVPATVVFTVWNVPESPAGAFVVAEAKIGCRSGARPRGLLVRGFCSSAEGTAFLSSKWGYPVTQANVSLTKRYDRIRGVAESGGNTLLDITLLNPEPIAGNDIQYLANLNVARLDREGATVARLIQSDPDYVFRSADRGKPEMSVFDADAFGLGGAHAYFPVSASYAVADINMPEVRYLVDPSKSPLASVERL
ncbi:MAG: acetoacetate decarboxylase family protein [bacterium]